MLFVFLIEQGRCQSFFWPKIFLKSFYINWL
jgi:hypothetical protein